MFTCPDCNAALKDHDAIAEHQCKTEEESEQERWDAMEREALEVEHWTDKRRDQ